MPNEATPEIEPQRTRLQKLRGIAKATLIVAVIVWAFVAMGGCSSTSSGDDCDVGMGGTLYCPDY